MRESEKERGMAEAIAVGGAGAGGGRSINETEPAAGNRSRVRQFLWENGLSIAVLGLFLGTMVGQVATGLAEHNNQEKDHGRRPIHLREYLTTGHFIEATAENWESEFLQMGMF